MMTLDEVKDLIENLNEQAHSDSWESWMAAEELADSEDEDDWSTAEELREDASAEQAEYFRQNYRDLDDQTQQAIVHWLTHDPGFREDFAMYYGEENFESDFEE